MLGVAVDLGRRYDEGRFYAPPKGRRYHQYANRNSAGAGRGCRWSVSGSSSSTLTKAGVLDAGDRSAEDRVAPAEAIEPSSCNLGRFLESTTPSVPVQYLSKTTMRGWRTCDVEFQPYFCLGDLWESFKEWSVYGTGVPLVLNGSDSVVQYYVPYLSGIQLFGETTRQPANPRRPGEDSDGDSYRDSSSETSSDSEFGRGLKCSSESVWCHPSVISTLTMDRLSSKEAAVQEGFSSDDSDTGSSRGCLLFEFFEQDTPYCREPLADKISNLAKRNPVLKSLRSCDLLPASWMSVAWYPIYRIPTGPTLRDMDACFLTFHSLYTPAGGAGSSQGPTVTYPNGLEDAPSMSLPIFGLASYKFKGSIWTPNGGYDWQLANSLLQAADNWVRLLQIDHPDYNFFASHGAHYR